MNKIKMFVVIVILALTVFTLYGCQESQKHKVWDNVKLPTEYKEIFGESYSDKLNFEQSKIINQHDIWLRGANIEKDGKKVHRNGIIDSLKDLQRRFEILEAVDPNVRAPFTPFEMNLLRELINDN